MKEIVIISGKGGTGKTSVAGALASLLPHAMLADCDVDAPDLHLLLQPQIQRRESFSGGKVARIGAGLCTACGLCRQVCRFDAITPDYIVEEMSCEGCGVCVWNCPEEAISFTPRDSGEWYISTTRYGDMVHARLHPGEENSGKLVTQVRRVARDMGVEKGVDILLVDGPPGVGCPVIAAIGGADLLVVVTEPTRSAIHDMERVVQLARHFSVPVGVCINKDDLNEEMAQDIAEFCLREELPLLGKIAYSEEFVAAQVQGKTIIELDSAGPEFQLLLENILSCL
ncbi:ATP-binding protein [candidate division KSB1 bacterium]|nr:ATP-binding protein [candidate division KSB1 bacterium]